MDNAAKIPEWAVKAACSHLFVPWPINDGDLNAQDRIAIDRLAASYVSTREAALREAARSLFEWANIPTAVLGAITAKILALIDKEPA